MLQYFKVAHVPEEEHREHVYVRRCKIMVENLVAER